MSEFDGKNADETIESSKYDRAGHDMMSFTTVAQDAGDGSGDLVLPIPDEVMDTLGWRIGDQLEIEAIDSRSFFLRKIDDMQS